MVNMFTVDEVCREIFRLKLRKKGGDDGLTNEHLNLEARFMSHKFIQRNI